MKNYVKYKGIEKTERRRNYRKKNGNRKWENKAKN